MVTAPPSGTTEELEPPELDPDEPVLEEMPLDEPEPEGMLRDPELEPEEVRVPPPEDPVEDWPMGPGVPPPDEFDGGLASISETGFAPEDDDPLGGVTPEEEPLLLEEPPLLEEPLEDEPVNREPPSGEDGKAPPEEDPDA